MSGVSALLALAKGQRPTWTADKQHLQIGALTLHRKTLTPYRLKGKSDFYPLDAVVFLLEAEEKKLKPAQYLTEAIAQKITAVNATQKAALLSYLRGEVSSTPDLDIAGLEALESQAAGGAQAGGEESKEGEQAGKRQRLSEEGAALRKPVSQWTVDDVLCEEQLLSTHLSVLQVPKKSFTPLLELYHKALGADKGKSKEGREGRERDSKSSRSDKDARRSSGAASAAAAPAPSSGPRDPNAGVPLIIVPSAVSSVVNMYNVKQLLENGIFESGEFVRMKSAAAGKEPLITISKASFYDPAKTVRFQVIDDVSKLKEEDWRRVVAVFASGAAWQFADWPKRWPNPAAIFENVCAFHLHFDDEALHPNILQWRTHRLPISKSKRHGDRSVVLDFWHILNEFIAARNATKKLNI